MLRKSINYWRNQYETSTYRQEDYNYKNKVDTNLEAAWKTLDLLAEYAAFYKHLPIIGLSVPWGGSFGRLFSSRSNAHGADVENAIANFYHMDGMYTDIEDFQRVDFVLALVKKKIGNKNINPNDDLAKIMNVIKEKTGIDYDTLDENAVYNNVRKPDAQDKFPRTANEEKSSPSMSG